MKTSTRILLFAALGLWLLLAVALVTLSRFVSGGDMPFHNAGGSDSTVTMSPTLGEFTEVELAGAWSARIEHGDRCTVSVTVPAFLDAGVTVAREDRRLVCRAPERHAERPYARIAIGMPDLGLLRTHGLCEVELRDMVLDSLRVRSHGVTRIRSGNLAVSALDYHGEGMGQLSVIDKGVTSAHVHADGMGTVALHMLGGSLSGQLSGMVRLHYTGDVSSNSITTHGMAATSHD